MSGSIGTKIGAGATSDVHAWAPGRVVKLYKDGIPRRISTYEAWVTRAVHAASGLAPEVFEEIEMEGRVGVVMARLDGPTLLQATKTKTVSYAEAGSILAGLLRAVHATPPPQDLLPLKAYMASSLKRSRSALPQPIAAGVMALIESLPGESALCHGDPNPGNVVMTAEGPKLLDWLTALRAPPAFDLASAQVMLTELAPHVADDPERPRATNEALQAAYARLSGMAPASLWASVEPYLPIVRALVILGGALPSQAARLIQRLEADFPA